MNQEIDTYTIKSIKELKEATEEIVFSFTDDMNYIDG